MSDTVYDVASPQFTAFAKDEMKWEDRTSARFSWEGNEFEGTILGFGSSQSVKAGDHTGHFPGMAPAQGVRCSACRWAEVALFRAFVPNSDTSMYAVVLMGKTAVEGEQTRVKLSWTEDAMSVLEALYVNGRDTRGSSNLGEVNTSNRRIPVPNAVSFRLAAEVDAGIRAVLADWESAIPDPDERTEAERF